MTSADSSTDSGSAIGIREVSQVHARWVEDADDVPGGFVLSVLLDDGATELVAAPSAKVLESALPLLGSAGSVVVDLERGQVLIGRIAIEAQRV